MSQNGEISQMLRRIREKLGTRFRIFPWLSGGNLEFHLVLQGHFKVKFFLWEHYNFDPGG